MIAGIAWQKKNHREFFQSEENNVQFQRIVTRTVNSPIEALSRVLQSKTVLWLRARGEGDAADWFGTYWCGSRGRWTIADAGVGHTINNCGPESKWEKLTKAVCGNSGKTKTLSVGVFTPLLIKYVSDISAESFVEQLKEYKTHRFLNHPKVSPALWKQVYEIDIRRLQFSLMEASREVKRKWGIFIDTIVGMEGHCVIRRLELYGSAHGQLEIRRSSVDCVILPSRSCFAWFDRNRPRTGTETFRDMLREPMQDYSEMVSTQRLNDFLRRKPDIVVEKMLDLNDMFNLVVPDDGKYKWKCNCKTNFRDGVCEEVMLLRKCFMTDYPTPPEFSGVPLRNRESSRKPGCFAPEPTFTAKNAPRGVWAPHGMSGVGEPEPQDSRQGRNKRKMIR